MQEIEADWGHALRIWWSLVWRVLVFGGLAGLLLGLLAGIAGAVTGIEEGVIAGYVEIGSMLVSIPVGIWAVKVILGKEFGKFRVLLVPSLESRIESSLNARQQPANPAGKQLEHD